MQEEASEPVSGIAGVVTAYRPDATLIQNIAPLLRQLSVVVVVDDGSGPGFEDLFAAVAHAGAVVVRLAENSGIAAALNAGIDRARQDGRTAYVLTVDQDSRLPQGYARALRDAAVAARAAGLEPGMVSPARIHGNPVKRAGSQHGIALGKEPIQSGLLIPVETLDAIGGFWEELFIDLVDTEFYFRALNAERPAVLADTEFDHSLGTMVEADVFGRTVRLRGRPLNVRIAAPWRYYYIFRNRVLVSRRYAARNPGWVATGVWTDVRHLLAVTLLAPGRPERLGYAFRGVRDGLRGRGGRSHVN
jgi:rhamnosyltransferase